MGHGHSERHTNAPRAVFDMMAQGHDEDPDDRYVGLDGRRPGKLPDFRDQPQDGNRQLFEHAAQVEKRAFSKPQNFLGVV
jgi:hypothetical protein